MKILRFAAACTVLCGVLLALPRGGAAGGDETYTIVIQKVEVKTTQKNGNSWDVNDGKPDLRVIIRNTADDSKAYETKEKTDTFAADFNEPTNVKFKKGHTLEIQVVDVDVAVNDVVGKVNAEMKAEKIQEGKMRLENFDQVIFLTFEIKKL